jgi:hypothetical protein
MLCGEQLGLCGYGLPGDVVEQMLEYVLRVVQFGLDFLKERKVLDYLLGKSIDGAGEMCKGGEEAGRAVGGFGRLLQAVRSESSGKGARIVIGRSNRGPALSGRRSCARRRRHGG